MYWLREIISKLNDRLNLIFKISADMLQIAHTNLLVNLNNKQAFANTAPVKYGDITEPINLPDIMSGLN